ncbi:MAG: glycosyltransferase family 4 protein [Rhodospirillaceae bacterium]|nr:glycosyltransferase family 4 protein [Rhodospirillaceae bacterium]
MTVNTPPKPRLLFLVTESSYFASHKMELAAAAVEAGFEVTVAARCDDPNMFIDAGFAVVPLAWKRTGSILAAIGALSADLLRVRKVITQVKPDVVHNISLKPAIIGSIAMLCRKTKVINSINGFGYVFYARSILAKAVQIGCRIILRLATERNAARIVLQNREDASYAREGMGIDAGHVRLIRGSGIDVQHFASQPEPQSSPIRFLILARLLHMKGIAVAIAALDLLRKGGVEAELVICGAPDPGNPSSIPESRIQDWSSKPHVNFKGQFDDVRPVIVSSHVVMLPALGGEGLPRALLEGAAMGRPLLATDIGGNREIVVPWETGMLVKPDDPDALAGAMAHMATHPEDRAHWGKAAREKVLGEFSSELIRTQHVALYREFIANSEGR